jgi:hypothetical protein
MGSVTFQNITIHDGNARLYLFDMRHGQTQQEGTWSGGKLSTIVQKLNATQRIVALLIEQPPFSLLVNRALMRPIVVIRIQYHSNPFIAVKLLAAAYDLCFRRSVNISCRWERKWHLHPVKKSTHVDFCRRLVAARTWIATAMSH